MRSRSEILAEIKRLEDEAGAAHYPLSVHGWMEVDRRRGRIDGLRWALESARVRAVQAEMFAEVPA